MQMDLLKCLSFSEILSNYAVLQIFPGATAIELCSENTVITTLLKYFPVQPCQKKSSDLQFSQHQILVAPNLKLSFIEEKRGRKRELHQPFSPCLTSDKVTTHTPMLGRVICLTHSSQTHAQPCLTLRDPMDCSFPGFSAHAILQVRILEWIAIPFSRGSSGPRD